MCRAVVVLVLSLSFLGAAADLSLLSQGLFGPGDGDSAYRDDPFSFSFSTAPVANDGTVFFISQATNLDIDASFELGADWDLFTRGFGGDPIAVSLRVDASPDVREGQAGAVAFAGSLVVSIRDNSLVAPTHQHLVLRSTANLAVASDIATGSKEFVHPRFSRNADFLVFAADDNSDVPSDSNGRRDIFVQSFSPVSLTRLSIRTAAGDSHVPRDALFPAISDDGQHVVFQSADSGFVAGDNTVDDYDIFYHNRQSDDTIRVNTRVWDPGDLRGFETGPCQQPTIDGAATTILFSSADPAIVFGDSNGSSDIFAYDIGSGASRRISEVDGSAEGSSEQPQISQSGRFIVFRSNATNFPNANGEFQIYLFDTASDSLETISLNSAAAPSNAACVGPAISPDGRYITFSTTATNLDAPSNGFRQLFLADRGPNFLNIRPEARPVDTYCSINASSPLELAGQDAESAENTLRFRLHDLPSASQGTIRLISGTAVTTTDTYTRADFPIIFIPAQDYVGSSILHYEVIDESGAVSQPAPISIFVNDFSNGIFELVSVGDRSFGTAAGQRRAMRGANSADSPVFRADSIGLDSSGRFAAFASNADNLSDEAQQGIFLRDAVERRTRLIEPIVGGMLIHRPTLSASGNALVHVQIGTPTVLIHHSLDAAGNSLLRRSTTAATSFHVPQTVAISEDGSTVLFASPSALIGADADSAADVYAWTPANESVALVSAGVNILPCTQPAISPDGTWAAFVSQGSHDSEVAESANQMVWLINLIDGAVEHLAEPGIDLSFPSLSRSGRYLAVQASTDAIVLDRDTDTKTAVNSASRVAMSANGRYLYLVDDQARRLEWGNGSSRIISAAGATVANAAVTAGGISGNGSVAIFASTASNLTADPDAHSDVFRIELGAIANFAPNATDSSETLDEDSSAGIALLVADPEGDDMLIEIVEAPSHGALSTIASGSLTYTPDQDYAGTDRFSWRAHDSTAFSREATVSITVNNLNDSPQLLATDDRSADEGEMVSFAVPVSDPDSGDLLTITATEGSVTDGQYSFFVSHDIASAGDTPVSLSVTLRVSDLAGASVSDIFVISVNDVNQAPSAENASLVPAEPRTTDDLVLSYNFTDLDGDAEGDTAIEWFSRDTPQESFQPAASDLMVIPAASTKSGQEWFAEIVPRDDRDAVGSKVTLPAVSITNSRPQAFAQTISLNEDSSASIVLMASDDDPDDSLSIVPGTATHGSLVPVSRAAASQTLRYIPAADFFGSDSFSYTVSDGADSASATITLLVIAQPDPPVLTLENAYIAESANSATLSISITDPDEPAEISQADYTLTFSTPTTGNLRTSQSDIISGSVTADALPISFTPDAGFSDETLSVFVTDSTGLDSPIRKLRIAAGVRFQTLALEEGWNLVCLVRDPLDFPFQNAFAWDASSQSLVSRESSSRGQAFWTHATRATELQIPGVPAAGTILSVEPGWNLLGGIGDGTSTEIPVGADIAWRWSRHFIKAESLNAGEGAWIHFPDATSVDFELTD